MRLRALLGSEIILTLPRMLIVSPNDTKPSSRLRGRGAEYRGDREVSANAATAVELDGCQPAKDRVKIKSSSERYITKCCAGPAKFTVVSRNNKEASSLLRKRLVCKA